MGKFIDRVDIQRDSSAAGSAVPDYSGTVWRASVPCKITSISGSETWRGRQLEGHRSHVVEMHYFEGVNDTMRLVVKSGMYRDCVLNVANVRPLERDGGKVRLLELYCVELAPQ